MIRSLLALLVLALAAAPVTAHAQTDSAVPPPAPIAGKGYHLVKNWDFGRSIRTTDDLHREFYTRFVYEGGRLDHLQGNGEWERYADNDNHRIVGNELQLIARIRGEVRDGGIESGMLRSKWTGEYGYFEARMKVPSGRGLWPAFWLNPEDQKWPPEIDVVEIVDNGRDTTRNSFHNVLPAHGRNADSLSTKLDKWGSYRPDFDFKDGFHVFAVEWMPGEVRHYVDGTLLADRHLDWIHDDGSDAGPAHVLVNLAVGGKWPEPPNNPADFPAKLEVDYIRVWQK
ncbi:MAG TPA: glycoside hydrolase family 16 protein [Stellaceae bacterium]